MEEKSSNTANGHLSEAAERPGEITVLFCSHDFERGFLYTQEACKNLRGIHVSLAPSFESETPQYCCMSADKCPQSSKRRYQCIQQCMSNHVPPQRHKPFSCRSYHHHQRPSAYHESSHWRSPKFRGQNPLCPQNRTLRMEH
jgi:hypothetical protein